jgi:hypothetical protein
MLFETAPVFKGTITLFAVKLLSLCKKIVNIFFTFAAVPFLIEHILTESYTDIYICCLCVNAKRRMAVGNAGQPPASPVPFIRRFS